jgi:hypothetical protein
LALQTVEVEFPGDLSYPYTFSILVANMNHGSEGEGDYSVQVFSKDQKMNIKKIN